MNQELELERERRLTTVETDVKTIMTNHLPHIQAAVDKVQDALFKLLWLLVTTAIGVAVSIGLIFFK